MSGRAITRRGRHHPAALAIALVLGTVAALDVLHWFGWLLATAAIAAGAYLAGRDRRSAPRPVVAPQPPGLADQLARTAAERDQLRARVADLTVQLADARESAELAWDAAASVAPQQVRTLRADMRDRLLADRFSGVRPLTPQ